MQILDVFRELRAWFREGPVVIQDKGYFRDDYMLRHYHAGRDFVVLGAIKI